MQITRKSILTSIERTQEINCTQKEYDSWLGGALAQEAFPNLSDDDREFIMTGITSQEWNELFKGA